MSELFSTTQLPPDANPSVLQANSQILSGDCLEVLRSLPSDHVNTCVTSPPYWGLRDYGIQGQIGAEPSIDSFIRNLVLVFREVRRVLRPDGTLWLNIGDSFTSGGRTWRDPDKKNLARGMTYRPATPVGLKPKDLIGVPWRLAFALQADGWYLRSDIVWNKPNGLPESVKDRPSRTHEFVFLLSRSEDYYYDHAATKEPAANGSLRAMRSVWNINTEPLREAHFAAFPTALVSRCLLAGCPKGGIALDPFFGAGTVGLVCERMQRAFIGIELNPDYVAIARKRLGWSIDR